MFLLLSAALASPAQAADLSLPHERYQLDNGLTVILHHDDSLPQVVVDTWYDVGSQNEVAGRTGFAHLFEHLMFMGTTRLPGSGFDDLMEQSGGWNNAWTSEDATNYYDVGPSHILELLLWMEADRMEGLDGAMTQEKLDLQRDVVRNERRQSVEDAPYGEAWEALNGAMYPADHPYAHPVIGSHEDLQAATVEDVVAFFQKYYVPTNASLVVAGDFDPVAVKALIEQTLGTVPRPPDMVVGSVVPDPVDLPVTPMLELTDEVQLPATMLTWHSPKVLTSGDAAMDVVASILGEGRSSRLYSALLHEQGLVTEVQAYQMSQELGSLFQVFALATSPDDDLEAIEAAVQAELDRLAQDGPTEEELTRTRNQLELHFLRELEDLNSRAENLNRYLHLTGEADYVAQDLQRYRDLTPDDIKAAAAMLSTARRQTTRIYPAPDSEGGEDDAGDDTGAEGGAQ
ncbi:MAG: insulinase family protein [Alphaproteobacteria bacterium]|nr:insulinase family protein [Alphaproteobacteria bacterium]